MHRTGLKLKDKSTQSKGDYLYDHILYGAILAYDIYYMLPKVIPIARYNNSIPRLLACMLLTSIFGILISYNYNRQGMGVIQDITAGVGLYIVYTIGEYASGITKWLVGGLIVISTIGIVFIASKKIKRKSRIKQIVFSRFLRSAQVVRRSAGVAAAIVIIALPIELNCFPKDKLYGIYYEKVSENYGPNAEDIQDEIGISGQEGELSTYELYENEYTYNISNNETLVLDCKK